MDELRRQMDRGFDDERTAMFAEGFSSRFDQSFLVTRMFDTGNALVLKADVPGLTQGDLKLNYQNDTLTLAGERKDDVPEGYTAHRQERGDLRFSRSFTLPVRVDVERSTAELKDGVLTVTFPKHPESQPREITVKA
jgi:HSP20 family protein